MNAWKFKVVSRSESEPEPVMLITYPPGSSLTTNGEMSNHDLAREILQAIANACNRGEPVTVRRTTAVQLDDAI
jgi:hypothetical protein